MLFTYIRDPVDRFISIFYELKQRQWLLHEVPDNDTERDLSEMRWMLNEMMKYKNENRFPWTFDKHLWPQMLFLTNSYGDPFRFNYIGLMENIDDTLPQILQKYQGISSEIVNNTMRYILLDGYSRSRKSDQQYMHKQYVSRDELNSEDLRLIRLLYWLDKSVGPLRGQSQVIT